MRAFSIIMCMGIIAVFMSGNLVYAQEEMQPKRFENVEWKSIVYIKYFNGKQTRAEEIIREYFQKAGEKAGTSPPEEYKMQTGKWDLMLIWNLKGGIEDLSWQRSPDNLKWWKAFSDLTGGPDKAQTVMDEYQSLVADTYKEVARKRK
jgi:hypothetical protein